MSFCFLFWRFSLVRRRFKFHPVYRYIAGLYGQKFVPLDWDIGCFNQGRLGLHINTTAKITENYQKAEIPVYRDISDN